MMSHWLCDETEWELAWRCMNCGEILDALIMVNHHRITQTPGTRVGRKRAYETR